MVNSLPTAVYPVRLSAPMLVQGQASDRGEREGSGGQDTSTGSKRDLLTGGVMSGGLFLSVCPHWKSSLCDGFALTET